MFGDDSAKQPMCEATKPPPTTGERTAQILTSFMETCGELEDDMVGLAVMGKHAFNGLPNHPSLDALKDDSEGDPKARVQKHLIAKGQEVKDTQLSVERACWMFEREINEELGTTTNEELKKMLRQILTDERPIKPLKPAELLDHLSSALKPYYAEREKRARNVTDAGALVGQLTKQMGNRLKNKLLRDMPAPQFVIADTNWGDPTCHKFFVVAPDPTTGEPTFWVRSDPPGTLMPAAPDWVQNEWATFGAPN